MTENKMYPTGEQQPAIEAKAPKNWYCVALAPSGDIYKSDADSPTEFLDVINRASVVWVDFVSSDFDKEAIPAATKLGFSEALVSSLTGEGQVTYQDFDTEMGIRLPSLQVREFDVLEYPLIMLLRKNLVLTIHPHNIDRRLIRLRRYADTFIRKIPPNTNTQDKLTTVMIRIIDINNDSNFRHLRQIEDRGDELNKDLMNPETNRKLLGPKIYEMKHSLISYLDGLWATVDVIHSLRFGDAELITDDSSLLSKIDTLSNEVSSQIGLTEHMSEVLASGLEVLQSIYNNQLQILNNRLALVVAYLTIIGTAFLVPNTIATIMGNSAFEMTPHDVGWYIALMVGSTVIATVGAYLWIRKMGWLPKKVE